MINSDYTQRVIDFSEKLKLNALKFTKNEEDANDLVQDTIIKAITNEDKFKEGTNLGAFLYITMRNNYINNYRKNKVKQKAFEEFPENGYEALESKITKSHKNQAIVKMTIDDCNKAINKLNDNCSQTFKAFLNGEKYEEMATKFNVPIGTIKTRIYVARKFLQKELIDYAA